MAIEFEAERSQLLRVAASTHRGERKSGGIHDQGSRDRRVPLGGDVGEQRVLVGTETEHGADVDLLGDLKPDRHSRVVDILARLKLDIGARRR